MTEASAICRCKEQSAAVRATIRGYAEAAAFIEQERIERLARMTPEEARAIYDDLCHSLPEARAENNLEAWRVTTLLSVRDAMLRVSRKRCHE